MASQEHNSYLIEIAGSAYQCVRANGRQHQGFLSPDTSGKLPKLYVVKHGTDVCYVGITKQDIRNRLRFGFTAQGQNGYHGYKWKDLKTVELLIWPFPDNEIGYVEAIEGELVFLVRERTGRWPLHQMEIHFHPAASDSQKMAAEEIFAALYQR